MTTGKQDVYFVFSGGDGSLFNLRWWKLNQIKEDPNYGDVDGNGVINILDVIMMKNIIIEEEYSLNGDIDSSSSVDSDDYKTMAAYFLGKIFSLIA